MVEVGDGEEGDGAEEEDEGCECDGEGGGVEEARVVGAEGGGAVRGGRGGERWPGGRSRRVG